MKSITFAEGIDQIIEEFVLPDAFPEKTVKEAAGLSLDLSQAVLKGRRDLRKEKVFTIDGEKARDFDDAVSIEVRPHGGYRLRVSIADVSAYVLPGSAIDQEAYRRGTSAYFPDRVLPMLPEKLSNDLCSLVPHKDRLTFTAEIDFDAHGKKIQDRFYKSIIRSVARLTYTEVRQMLIDQDPGVRGRYASILPDLELMKQLATLLMKQRSARGSLDFDLPEPQIILDLEEKTVEGIILAERNFAHRLIEEFMIAANEAVAEHLFRRKIPSLYRVHSGPESEKLMDFKLLIHNLGVPAKLGAKAQPEQFAKILKFVQGKRYEKMVSTLLIRVMGRAVYDFKNQGHFGLASKCYTHFTSPIRRYPDLIVHRVLGGLLGSQHSVKNLEQIAKHSSDRERVAMKSEWASRDLAAAFFMKDKIGTKFEGVISGVAKFGLFVQIFPYYVEGMLPMKNLKDDYYIFMEKQHAVVGRRKKKKFQLGDAVTVVLDKVNLEKRWVDLRLDSQETEA